MYVNKSDTWWYFKDPKNVIKTKKQNVVLLSFIVGAQNICCWGPTRSTMTTNESTIGNTWDIQYFL
jgi:hypothetical protein